MQFGTVNESSYNDIGVDVFLHFERLSGKVVYVVMFFIKFELHLILIPVDNVKKFVVSLLLLLSLYVALSSWRDVLGFLRSCFTLCFGDDSN